MNVNMEVFVLVRSSDYVFVHVIPVQNLYQSYRYGIILATVPDRDSHTGTNTQTGIM